MKSSAKQPEQQFKLYKNQKYHIQSIFKKPIYQRKSPQILSHTRNQSLSIMIQGPSDKIFINSQQRMKDTASATKKSITAVTFGEELDRGPHSKGMI